MSHGATIVHTDLAADGDLSREGTETPERLISDHTSSGASTIITTSTSDGQAASQPQAAPPDPDSDLSVTDLR